MKRFLKVVAMTASLVACGVQPAPQPAQPDSQLKTQVDQGDKWFLSTQTAFYTTDQGSRIMPLRWFMNLKQVNGQPFLPDGEGLSRYGYLKNENSPTTLPAGFTVNGPVGNQAVGMSCAACHTRQIEVGGKPYRIDGGPAIVDFQAFLQDLDKAVGKLVANNDDAFKDFAGRVLQGSPSAQDIGQLYRDVTTWYRSYHEIVRRSMPANPWGPSRLDAISMIFNRLTGLDIGQKTQNYLIPNNIKPAVAPARYPFLWNAAIQDHTQWPGFAPNGNDLYGLVRNIGEVIGVFAQFHPVPDTRKLSKIDYNSDNSSNVPGLLELENLIKKIGPPKFQWTVDEALAKQGEEIFNWPVSRGSGCADCHGIRLNKPDLFGNVTWVTPIQDVGTDSREYDVLKRTAETGILMGTKLLPFVGTKLPPVAPAKDVLVQAVGGTILQRLGTIAQVGLKGDEGSEAESLSAKSQHTRADMVMGAFVPASDKDEPFKYESRVMQGIWAAAPYLHNGSVPTLADLLEPVSNRPTSFQIGPNYDPTGKVGLAADQTKFPNFTLRTGCKNRNSGDSNCGHEYGVWLKPAEKKALLEYLKTL